jgi:uncharacterized protein YgiM (DUF1202 family)
MKFAAPFLALVLCLAASAWAQDQGFINRSSELKDRAAADARTLATLPENTAVKVISRGGSGWTQVEANGQKGWVKAFHLRFPTSVEKGASSGSGPLASITSVFGGRESQKTTSATTGVRGLSPDDLKNASPDGAALAKAQSYRADKPAAERFARDGKLVPVNVEEGGRR